MKKNLTFTLTVIKATQKIVGVAAILLLMSTQSYAQQLNVVEFVSGSMVDAGNGFGELLSNVPSNQTDSTKGVYLKEFGFKELAMTTEDLSKNGLSQIDEGNNDISLKIIDEPLCYPSPFRSSVGTELRFSMNNPADLEVRIYDMSANEVFKAKFPSGGTYSLTSGDKMGVSGTNSLSINKKMIGGDMSAGVYFVMVMNQGKILGRTKVAVIP